MSWDIETSWPAIGWTMLHFLWIGGVITLLTAAALIALRNASANLRYGVAVAGLSLLAMAPAVIHWRTARGHREVRPLPVSEAVRDVQGRPADVPLRVNRADVPADSIIDRSGKRAVAAIATPSAAVKVSSRDRFEGLARGLPWLWLIGSPLTFAWLALGMLGAERLRRNGKAVNDAEWLDRCRVLAGELGIKREVVFSICDALTGPVLVGIVRPMILIPSACLGCWSPEQIEMVLLHELAHVKRWDNLVNLVQRLIESALFFHPGVWIVSAWVSREREYCCDAIVVTQTGAARTYAETLVGLARSGTNARVRANRPSHAMVAAMAQHDLVGRVRRILDPQRERDAMKLPQGLIAFAAFAMLSALPATLTLVRAVAASNPTPPAVADPPAKPKADPKPEPEPEKIVLPAQINGKTIDEWLKGLEDRDPVVRRKAIEVLGERALNPDVNPVEKTKLLREIRKLHFDDPDDKVREAVAFFSDLHRVGHDPEQIKQAIEARKRLVEIPRMPVRVVDSEGKPVKGAVVSRYFQRDVENDQPSFQVPEGLEAATSDAQGRLAIDLAIYSHLDADSFYAYLERPGDTPLVGMTRISRAQARSGEPVTIVLYPACRVRLRVECPGFREIAEKYHAELGGDNWWRAAYVWHGEDHRSPRPLFTSSTTGQLEFLLPPGRFMIMAYGSDANNVERTIEIKPGQRLVNLGSLETSPGDAVKQGIFRGYWRSVRRGLPADADANNNEQVDDQIISFHPPHGGKRPQGDPRFVRDIAYSPDGTLLATAIQPNGNPGEIKLWDTKTGQLVAKLPVTVQEMGFYHLAFSKDGQSLAAALGVLTKLSPKSGAVVVWDIKSRSESKVLRGQHAGRINALAFAPDGRSLASGGDGQTVIWDLEGNREIAKIDGKSDQVRSLAYSPDGRRLAIGGSHSIKLWDVNENRLRPSLDPKGIWAESVAFSADGRSLAVAGTANGYDQQAAEAQVRIYDLNQDPISRRATLTVRGEAGRQPDWISDAAFTPDGSRVVALAMEKIVVWDAATGDELESLDRHTGSSIDRLAISPDGQWLTTTSMGGGGIVGIMSLPSPKP